MARKFSELREKMPPASRQRAEARAKKMLDEMPLQKLRIDRGLSQEEMSRRLKVSQARVSKVERHADLCIQTLYSHIEAMGGQLKIVANFPDGEREIAFPRGKGPLLPAKAKAGGRGQKHL